MSLILQIDTHMENASVSLSRSGKLLEQAIGGDQKDQAAFLQPAIQQVLRMAGHRPEELGAISVVAGPGSYTGLRVGMASAKGLCFALGIPLITINSLEWMAYAARDEEVDFLCPMIDARRNEVFTGIFHKNGEIFSPPGSMILNAAYFEPLLQNKRILFFGSGAIKFSRTISNINAIFKEIILDCDQLASLSWQYYESSLFADLAYCEPLYLKEFYSAITPQQAK